MEIVFFGTPDYVLPILTSLDKNLRDKGSKSPIAAVVTQRPKPKGRKKFLAYSPVDSWAHKHNVPIFYDSLELKTNNIKVDLGIVASYGAIIPEEIIKYFPKGILVVHPSLLPSFRWGSPIPGTLITGTNPTGVTIIKMDEKFDHGPIISQYEKEVLPDDTTGSLLVRLFESAAPVLAELIPPYFANKITPRPQDDSQASFARMLTKEDAFIPPKYFATTLQGSTLKDKWEIPFIKPVYSMEVSPESIDRFIRAMDPWPGAWTYIQLTTNSKQPTVKRLKILKAHLDTNPVSRIPYLVLDLVQLESKNAVSWKEFVRSYPALLSQ